MTKGKWVDNFCCVQLRMFRGENSSGQKSHTDRYLLNLGTKKGFAGIIKMKNVDVARNFPAIGISEISLTSTQTRIYKGVFRNHL